MLATFWTLIRSGIDQMFRGFSIISILTMTTSVLITGIAFSQDSTVVKETLEAYEAALKDQALKRLNDFDARAKAQAESFLSKGGATMKELVTLSKDAKGFPILTTSGGIRLSVTDPNKLAGLPTNEPIMAEFGDDNGKANISRITIMPVATWEKSKSLFNLKDHEQLIKAFQDLDDTVAKLHRTGSMGAAPQLSEKLEKTSSSISNFYSQQKQNLTPEQIGALAEMLSATRYQKAIYGRTDIYKPFVYKHIFENASAAVALYNNIDDIVHGTGVLIAKDVVLTCRHCVEHPRNGDFTPDQLQVRFDFEDDDFGNPKPVRMFEVDKILFKGKPTIRCPSNPLDFALILLKKVTINGMPKSAGELYRPAVLSKDEAIATRDRAIYVIGHPQSGSKRVHDNAFVLFPFQANEKQFSELELIVIGEIKSSPDESRMLSDFHESYTAPNERQIREQYRPHWGGLPVIGADCDTFHGNSGSAAWDRIKNHVIGILFSGEPDQKNGEKAYTAGWRRHEAILPIGEVIRQLNKEIPNWDHEYGVEIAP